VTDEPAPVRIAQVSDIHCGSMLFDEELLRSTVERVNTMAPDVVVVAGDLTAEGFEREYEEAAGWLDRLEAPMLVIPGNHDARNLGYLHFERLYGERFPTLRIDWDRERAESVGADGLTIVGVDSSEPDKNAGRIGREWYPKIEERFSEEGHLKIFVIHHHLVSIPGTGRERSTVEDAGDLLDLLSRLQVDLVLSGHKHVPFFWGLNGILICNSGTAATRRVRGRTPPSFNEIGLHADRIEVHTHYPDGRRELSVRRDRAVSDDIREALTLTPEFRETNRVDRAVVDG
jgi:3',5'-cyclic AMP phosphodiesterase CpdA